MKITAFFGDAAQAHKAIDYLRDNGFINTVLDMNEHYVPDRNTVTNLAGTETGPSLSGLTLKSSDHTVDRSKAPLTAASPMASGIGGFEETADYNITVKVDVSEGDEEWVRDLLAKAGGELENPNIPTPKGLEKIATDKMFEGLQTFSRTKRK